MLALSPTPAHKDLTVRRVDKASDRPIIREVFCKEFFGDHTRQYPDEGLWEIYDKMETEGIFGAYLVYNKEDLLFLLEIYPPVQMDLSAELQLQRGDIGIYCFFSSFHLAAIELALKACLDALLDTPGIRRIITAVGHAQSGEPRVILLERAGFERLADSTERLSIYECIRKSF
jgi:hypothetical protein